MKWLVKHLATSIINKPQGMTYTENRMNTKKRNGSTYRWRKIRQEILKRDEFTCLYCGGIATHIDHVTSLDKGGTDEPNNLVSSCSTCNLRKGTKSARQFIEEQAAKKHLKPDFFDRASTSPTPSLSFHPREIDSPFEPPTFE
jgi:5-methylcytosine-specific restriction endonuclease McrA